MTIATLVFIAVLALATLVAVKALGGAYLRWRGARVIVCPETKTFARVEVDALRALATTLGGARQLRLKDCSRWPERHLCGQECLAQIEAAPEDCLAWTMAASHFRGRSCALCGRPFRELSRLDHQPALMDSGRRTVQWHLIAAEHLPDALATRTPVCWDCDVIETFRREHPELVVDATMLEPRVRPR